MIDHQSGKQKSYVKTLLHTVGNTQLNESRFPNYLQALNHMAMTRQFVIRSLQFMF